GPRAHAPQPGEGHDADGRRVHMRSVSLPSTAGTVTLTAAAPWAMVQKPVRGALLPLLAILAILGAVLGGAALVQLRLGLRPLRRLRADVAAVRDGRAQTVEEDQPEELRPLATELNALLQDNARTLATARASAANLAHALKTPVAALALELRDDPPRAALVDRLYGTIRHHLARARNAVTERRAATSLAETIADLLGTVAQLHADRELAFDDTAQTNVAVAIERSDLEELLGNLLDNAARHAASRVAIATTAQDGTVRITVSDDGPGIPVADRLRATAPGVRLDERGDGDGFGLAIVRDLAELNGGRLLLDEAPGGGLAATVELPRAGGAS
ncbi:sensor histidine kinase, partial [uncultured Novosphingobium sp.]|uniref:sensor histidine kinase n=1 Tax=uncultured Novosphingobium sp. TaxID=292277 RepID=UPI003748B4E2